MKESIFYLFFKCKENTKYMKLWTQVIEILFPKGRNNQRRQIELLTPITDYPVCSNLP